MKTTTTVPPTETCPTPRPRPRPSRPMVGFPALVGALVLAAVAWGQDPAPAAGAGKKAEPAAASSARAALRTARAALDKVHGLKGESRMAALQDAEKGFRDVVAQHGDNAEVAGRAWYEIGELLRRQKKLADAEAAYGKALDLDAAHLGERALLQRANMLRRLKRLDEALAAYRKTAEIKPGSARAHEARTWIGRCLLAKGDADGAVAAFERALEVTTVPHRVIDLCNRLAKVQIGRGQLDAAAAVIERAERAVPAGDGPGVERLHKALQSMSARRALQRARDKANRAHQDAVEVEKAGKSTKG